MALTPRRVIPVATALVVAAGVVGVAAYAASPDSGPPGSPGTPARTTADLELDWQARSDGVQVLGGTREPGTPSVQRIRHDDVVFTVTVAPARPGPNLVRVDVTKASGAAGAAGATHSEHATRAVEVGTRADFDAGTTVRAAPRPGASGLWATVDLPEGSGTVLLSHGRWHRVPFAVDTGTTADARSVPAAYAGPDGPECLAATTSAYLAGGSVPDACPSDALSDDDAETLAAATRTLIGRGVTELAVQRDESPRSAAAYDLVRSLAEPAGVTLVDPSAAPGQRNALLVVGGWDDAATSLTDVLRRPLPQQPIRSDGTWLAPWLLTPEVVDSTSGAVLALDFDIRSAQAQEFSQTLATLFPGQAPTASGYHAWRTARGGSPSPLSLYAASRAAYMPASSGHQAHESQVAWFPGGTVTPVAGLISEGP